MKTPDSPFPPALSPAVLENHRFPDGLQGFNEDLGQPPDATQK